MGNMLHHSIIITSFDDDSIKSIHKEARKTFKDLVSEIIDSKMNNRKSFFIAPDGSSENLDYSNTFDKKRKEFLIELKQYEYLSWTYVQYGDNADNYPSTVIEDSNWIYNIKQ